jgi:aldose 1-epimerase
LLDSPKGVPSMGAFIGRYANRISKGQFLLAGKRVELAKNSANHSIHGGPQGSRYVVFDAEQTAANHLVLKHTFTPLNDGFPGQVQLTLSYVLENNNRLRIAWQAKAVDAPTVASFTSHVFFNLSGHSQQTVHEHRLKVFASHYLPLNLTLIPQGQLHPVAQTVFDFLNEAPLSQGLNPLCQDPQIRLCNGFDHHFVVDAWQREPSGLKPVAHLFEPTSGRELTVHSTEPGLQLFTANSLVQAQCGFAKHAGVCLEPSYFPDSPNQPQFPSVRMEPGQVRYGEIVYAFGVRRVHV